jgi:vancomycin resistance protein YoaR
MNKVKTGILFVGGALMGAGVITLVVLFQFEQTYRDRVYPGIFLENTPLSRYRYSDLIELAERKEFELGTTAFTFIYEARERSISASELSISLNKDRIPEAVSYGKGMNIEDIKTKLHSFLYSIHQINVPVIVIPLEYSYDTVQLTSFIQEMEQEVNAPAVEPVYTFDPQTNRVLEFTLGKEGQKLSTEDITNDIEHALKTAPGEQHTITLNVETVEPTTGNPEIDKLGITELIATGESYFKGSIPGRVHNVVLGASRASGVLIAPGEVFSFNKTVGEVSGSTGYKTAYVIKQGRTQLDDGGGICQVSTTIFRAALNAGLEIIERKPHSYRVSYYEQGGFKPGLDATVFSPTVDLKIKNNTERYILLKAIPDPQNFKLTYEIYGKKDGRLVTVSDVKILSQSSAPAPLYQEDSALPSGQIKQVDWAAGGAKTVFDYTVERNGEVLGASTFVNNFKPWQAVYLYGPGTAVPTPTP